MIKFRFLEFPLALQYPLGGEWVGEWGGDHVTQSHIRSDARIP